MNSGTPVPGHFAVRLVATTLNIGVTFLTGADAGARSFAQRGRSGPSNGRPIHRSDHTFEQIRW
jgi:hypothetical protein